MIDLAEKNEADTLVGIGRQNKRGTNRSTEPTIKVQEWRQQFIENRINLELKIATLVDISFKKKKFHTPHPFPKSGNWNLPISHPMHIWMDTF